MPYDINKDPYSSHSSGISGQAGVVLAVVPSDSVDLTLYAKALYIGVSGDVRVLPIGNADGAPVTFKAHPVGYMPIRVRRVYATGTTATDILALQQ